MNHTAIMVIGSCLDEGSLPIGKLRYKVVILVEIVDIAAAFVTLLFLKDKNAQLTASNVTCPEWSPLFDVKFSFIAILDGYFTYG